MSLREQIDPSAIELSHEEVKRYSRHLIMPEVGMAGQKKLKASSVLLIGAGGLGSPLAMYLAAAGVGRIGLVDYDVVDYTNLQRQIIHGTKDVGRPKLHSAADRIRDINPHVQLDLYELPLTSANALEILAPYDVIIDGTDNFPTRYLTNDACVLLGKPNVYGSIFRFEGQASVFNYEGSPCYRCLYPEPPPPGLVPSCAEGGVLVSTPGARTSSAGATSMAVRVDEGAGAMRALASVTIGLSRHFGWPNTMERLESSKKYVPRSTGRSIMLSLQACCLSRLAPVTAHRFL